MSFENNSWSWISLDEGSYLQSDLLKREGFQHAFFSKEWEGKGPKELTTHLDKKASVHQLNQVHSNKIIEASDKTTFFKPKADGLISNKAQEGIWVCSADCIPLLIANTKNGDVAACHAGWRGVAGRIAIKAIQRLEKKGSLRKDLLFSLGPAISGKNYQVMLDTVNTIYSGIQSKEVNSEITSMHVKEMINQGFLSYDKNPNRFLLDLRLATAKQLQLNEISSHQISICPLCTYDKKDLFFSWRREQVKAIQWSGIISR